MNPVPAACLFHAAASALSLNKRCSVPKRNQPQQFSYRVRKSVDCIITVEASNQDEADQKINDAGNWIDEQDVDCPDWEVRGRA